MNATRRHQHGVPSAADDSRSAFIGAAPRKSPSALYPWQAAGVRSDLEKALNTMIPEDLHIKLGWLRNESGRTLKDITTDALSEYFARNAQAYGFTP